MSAALQGAVTSAHPPAELGVSASFSAWGDQGSSRGGARARGDADERARVADDPSASTPTDRARTGRPNVVLILTDDMRADELRYLPKTRRLLVARGVRFSTAISPHPMCCPARAELVSGQYDQINGVRHNTGPWGGAKRLRDPDDTIGRWLQAAGYRTSYHGKFLNDYERQRPRYEPAGWTIWDAQMRGIYSYRW